MKAEAFIKKDWEKTKEDAKKIFTFFLAIIQKRGDNNTQVLAVADTSSEGTMTNHPSDETIELEPNAISEEEKMKKEKWTYQTVDGIKYWYKGDTVRWEKNGIWYMQKNSIICWKKDGAFYEQKSGNVYRKGENGSAILVSSSAKQPNSESPNPSDDSITATRRTVEKFNQSTHLMPTENISEEAKLDLQIVLAGKKQVLAEKNKGLAMARKELAKEEKGMNEEIHARNQANLTRIEYEATTLDPAICKVLEERIKVAKKAGKLFDAVRKATVMRIAATNASPANTRKAIRSAMSLLPPENLVGQVFEHAVPAIGQQNN